MLSNSLSSALLEGLVSSGYSNLSYIVAGAAIDRVAQTSFEDALERYIFQPVGVDTAGFGAPEHICGHRARVTMSGIGLFRGPPKSPNDLESDNPQVYSSAGCLSLSLDDWSTLMQIFLAGSNTTLLRQDSLKTIFHPPAQSGRSMVMGLDATDPKHRPSLCNARFQHFVDRNLNCDLGSKKMRAGRM